MIVTRGIMKLSEALRIGSAGREQIKGNYYTTDRKKCCALGAIVIAAHADIPNSQCLKYFEILHAVENYGKWSSVILNWNDILGFSFDQIIKLLEAQGQ